MRFALALCSVFAIVLALSASSANASVQFDLQEEFNNFSGAPNPLYKPQGPIPWLTVRIYDSTDTDPGLSFYNLQANEALIVMDANLIGTEYVSHVGLNYDGAPLTSVKYLGGTLTAPVNVDYDLTYTIDNSGMYEMFFDFGIGLDGSGYAVFKATVSAVNTIKADSTSAALDDFVQNAYGVKEYYAAAEIRGIGNAGAGSTANDPAFIRTNTTPSGGTGEIPQVPEPASLAIWSLGLGIAGLVGLRRRK